MCQKNRVLKEKKAISNPINSIPSRIHDSNVLTSFRGIQLTGIKNESTKIKKKRHLSIPKEKANQSVTIDSIPSRIHERNALMCCTKFQPAGITYGD
jgi:hypothetical protein